MLSNTVYITGMLPQKTWIFETAGGKYFTERKHGVHLHICLESNILDI